MARRGDHRAPGPVTEYAPLVKLGDHDVNTQYSMEWVERVGLLKMDFLGLRTLTVMAAAAKEIRRTADSSFELDEIPLDDPKTYALLSNGQTSGVFQLESDGMRRYIARPEADAHRGRPHRHGGVVPARSDADWIGDFIAGKHGRLGRSATCTPNSEPILEETYGIAVYQEQSDADVPGARRATRSDKPTPCAKSSARRSKRTSPSSARSSSKAAWRTASMRQLAAKI